MSAPRHAHPLHRALADCPVCGEQLLTTRLGCTSCGTELVGQFAPCPYCALGDADHELLRVFLASRGNLKDLQAHLGVSYPTARARLNDVLDRLGWLAEADPDPDGGADADAEPGAPTEPDGGVHDAGRTEGHSAGDAPGASGPQGTAEGTRGSEQPPASSDAIRDQVLAQVASGQLSPAVAADLLDNLR